MKKMPAHLPPLPDGYVYAGRLGDYGEGKRLHGLVFEDGDSEWFGPTGWVGVEGDSASGSWHYAAPADSEIARLNGCGKPSWESAPEWAEWLAQDSNGDWCWYKAKPEVGRRIWWAGGDSPTVVQYPRHAQPNPNWRDTLERRPGKPFYESADDAENEIRWASGESADFYFGTIKCDATPDLIIPADIAKHADIHSLVALHRDGYRIEWDSNGIRGWKE